MSTYNSILFTGNFDISLGDTSSVGSLIATLQGCGDYRYHLSLCCIKWPWVFTFLQHFGWGVHSSGILCCISG